MARAYTLLFFLHVSIVNDSVNSSSATTSLKFTVILHCNINTYMVIL
jgi:hypothetical protein